MTDPVSGAESASHPGAASPAWSPLPAEGAPGGVAACTIVSKNYLAYARTLATSFRERHPDAPFYVMLVDAIDGCFAPEREPFEIVLINQLAIPNLARFCFQYSILELNTAVKPYFLEHLFRQHGLRKVVYLDPDIQVMGPLDPVYELLDTHAIVLTPHLTAPLPDDGRLPSEIDILQAGTYNLGFLGVAAGPTTERLLGWWKARLYDRCRVDVEHGMHVDQRWMDLVPGFFGDVFILRDDAYNVAYWNLPTRELSLRDGTALANGTPIRFMHFSGIDPRKPDVVSKHDTRLTLDGFGEAAVLFRRYAELLLENGYLEALSWPYAFGRFDNGVAIPLVARQLYLELGDEAERFGNPFAAELPGSYYQWLLEDAEEFAGEREPISRLLAALYRRRPDVQRAFPRPAGADHAGFMAWVEKDGRLEYGLDRRLLRRASGRARNLVIGAANGAERAAGPTPKPGLNVAGFVASEKGVGQAVRSMIRALQAAGIPHAINHIVDPMSLNEETGFGDLSPTNPYAVNLALLGIGEIPWFVDSRPREYFAGRRNIVHLAWELADLPVDLARRLGHFDEAWVASSYIAEALRKVTDIPVARVPYPIVDEAPLNLWHPFHFGIPRDTFVFLFMFDFSSYAERKNPLGLIEAFKRAFRPDDPVLLLLKCARSEEDPSAMRAIQEAARGANVRITEGMLSRQRVRTLIQLSDCYVSLHRAEGFGLTMAEAMVMGKPVIATGYSGNMDFMNGSNSFPVRYRVTELERDHGPYRKGLTWADPDLDHAAELMRFVFENRDLAREIGRIARRDILTELGPEAVGLLIERQLRPWLDGESARRPPGSAASRR